MSNNLPSLFYNIITSATKSEVEDSNNEVPEPEVLSNLLSIIVKGDEALESISEDDELSLILVLELYRLLMGKVIQLSSNSMTIILDSLIINDKITHAENLLNLYGKNSFHKESTLITTNNLQYETVTQENIDTFNRLFLN